MTLTNLRATVLLLSSLVTSGLSLSAQERPDSVATREAATVIEGDVAGTAAGASKSVMAPGVIAGSTSMLLPGAGLIYLAFLRSGEVEPNFAEQMQLKSKSTDYVDAWIKGYDRAATARQKKSILIGTAIGSVIGFSIWKSVFEAADSVY